MNLPVPRPEILSIAPYVGGESQLRGVNRVIKLSSNESALGPSPRAILALQDAALSVHRYPDGTCRALRHALGETFGLDPERIVCGAGSDELFGLLARAYAGPGDEVLHTVHGFAMFPIVALAAGARPVAVPEIDLRADVNALLAAVTPATKLLFLANPNNPTGTLLSLDEVVRLRRGLPDHVLLVLDAAYAEYVSDPDYDPGFGLVDTWGNVVVTRTFSKIYGLGGARLGWAYGPPAVVDVLNRLRMPFNVSAPAQAAGIAALADCAFVEEAQIHNNRLREWTIRALRDLGLTVPDSCGNFALALFPQEPGRDAAAADAFLRARGIIVRRMNSYHLPQALRISIGQDDEMQACVSALAAFVTANRNGA